LSVRRAEIPPDERLERALLDRIRRPLEVGGITTGSVAFDIEGGEGWTLRIEHGRWSLSHGLDPGADTTITTDPVTAVAIVEGSMSGVEAFVSGRLRVRGNLALSLRLSGSFPDGSRPARFATSRTVEANGVETFQLEASRGAPVVLLHGLGATNASMLTTLWELSKDMRVIAPDLPGFGDSSKPIRSYDAEFFGRWVIALLDRLEIERAHLVGNSLGGRVAIEAALCEPERVDRIALLAPSPAFIRKREFVRLVRLLRPELALIRLPLSHARVVGSIKAMFSKPSRLPDAWFDAAADEFLRVFSSPRGRIAFFSAARNIYLEEPFGERGFWDRLEGLTNPALFIWGARDRLVPAKFARHLERALPNARSIVVDDCGHVPQFELPERTHALTREFLNE
jgi:pimeloyl-ACP methyl ester carboxylesterase